MSVVDVEQWPASRSTRARAWADEADISARSTLVTILGDTVAPLGGTMWLGELIALAEPFGFNDRLVRTSLFRLAAEGWVTNQRVGRRSRYSLTDYGRRETGAAELRIYRPAATEWDGWWTLAFLPDGVDETTSRHLRWRGFARMADGVLARPDDHTVETRELLDELGVAPTPPVAAARFDDRSPVADEAFRHDSGLAEAEEAYRRFLDRYAPKPADQPDLADLAPSSPSEAFALRTMVVHDLRRARLRDPDLPAALLPADWIGHRAVGLAAEIHRSVTELAWNWVTELTGATIDLTSPPLSDRFPPGDRP